MSPTSRTGPRSRAGCATLLALLAVIGGPPGASGQTGELAVMSAVASHLRPTLAGKVVIVSDRYHPTRRSEAENEVRIPGVVQREIERLLPAHARPREYALQCSAAPPGHCRLTPGADLLITFSQPDIGPDEARVVLEERAQSTDPAGAFSFLARELILKRSAAGWTVTSDQIVASS